MKTIRDQYTSTSSFPWVREPPQLDEKTKSPRRVVLARWTRSAGAVLHEHKGTVMCGDLGAAQLVLDFEEEVVGTVEICVSTERGATLKVLYGESCEEALQETSYSCGWYAAPEDVHEIGSGQHTVLNPGRRAFRYLHLMIPHGAGSLAIRKVSVRHRTYPVVERGHFSCSDALLNRTWQISTNTTRLCMQQFYEDGVKRDGLLWISDYRVQFLCNLFAFGDHKLARKSLYMIAGSQRDDGAGWPPAPSRHRITNHEPALDKSMGSRVLHGVVPVGTVGPRTKISVSRKMSQTGCRRPGSTKNFLGS